MSGPVIFDEHENLQLLFQGFLAESRTTGKRILVEYGGDWCIWSVRMAALLERPEFKSLIRDHFLFVRCHVGRDGVMRPAAVEVPEFRAIPFFALMDSAGRIVATQSSKGFELLWFYRKAKVLAFLQRWTQL